MPNPSRNKLSSAVSRLKQDYLRLKKDPLPYVKAEPLPNNILEWHYVVIGPEDTPYEGGYYHGKLVFPNEFPFKPPSIYMITPNGRFLTNTRLCLSISDYHPDTWNPAWSVGTILTGLLSFMLRIRTSFWFSLLTLPYLPISPLLLFISILGYWFLGALSYPLSIPAVLVYATATVFTGKMGTEETKTLGSVKSTPVEKKQYAYHSLKFNLQDKNFRELFPDECKEIRSALESRKAEEGDPEGDPIGIKLARLKAQQEINDHGRFLTALANIAVVIGFAAFAYTVKYVLRHISYD